MTHRNTRFRIAPKKTETGHFLLGFKRQDRATRTSQVRTHLVTIRNIRLKMIHTYIINQTKVVKHIRISINQSSWPGLRAALVYCTVHGQQQPTAPTNLHPSIEKRPGDDVVHVQ